MRAIILILCTVMGLGCGSSKPTEPGPTEPTFPDLSGHYVLSIGGRALDTRGDLIDTQELWHLQLGPMSEEGHGTYGFEIYVHPIGPASLPWLMEQPRWRESGFYRMFQLVDNQGRPLYGRMSLQIEQIDGERYSYDSRTFVRFGPNLYSLSFEEGITGSLVLIGDRLYERTAEGEWGRRLAGFIGRRP
jgi:hypothetical protein